MTAGGGGGVGPEGVMGEQQQWKKTRLISMLDEVRRILEPTTVLKEMAYILFYIKQGSSPWFSSLIETQNAKVTLPLFDTSPISVLDYMGGALSPSSAEETSSGSSRVIPEKEGPGPCPTISPEPITASIFCLINYFNFF